MTFSLVIAAEARTDIRDILAWSQARFGDAVREGYEELIFVAISAIAEDPTRIGAHARPELGQTVQSWHLALSRDHVDTDVHRIVSPRHFVIYRQVGDKVHILRVLHEAMSLHDHRIS
ncbi:type II toxin-antitoxin system RelE/ParE family toxin [Gryllotalpicola sp.]|uniref:type II toxin-antitoxin system RelE/ParE family toxin n=1 Tax=Gryllotalpicola sp. TaxID=1932787 RepID=UPI002630DC5A|nr:type II toxin-antitoxin system RelE/ParE family toxin [Gryllotalpicola sp.]